MSEIHVAGCVAYVRPESAEAIVKAIHATSLAEVPRRDEAGHLVVLIERESVAAVLDVIDAIRALDGVLAVELAYQHSEDEDAMNESHGADAGLEEKPRQEHQ